jgi:hypothetical protein
MPSDFPTVPKAFAAYSAAREAYSQLDVACQNAKPARKVPRQAAEALFSRAAAVMLLYYDSRNWPEGYEGEPLHPFPPELAADICEQTRLIIAGISRGPLGDLLGGRGSPSNGPIETRDQGWAVAYVDLAKEGIIKDVRYTATVANKFAVTPRAIQQWKKDQASKGIVWRDIVGKSSPDEGIAEYVTAKMNEAGERYAKKGRLATPRKKPDVGLGLLRSRTTRS